MDNGSGRNPMAETVYGTEDSTMVMSEKVKCEKSIDGGVWGGDSRNHTERKSPGKIKSDDLPYAFRMSFKHNIELQILTDRAYLSLAQISKKSQ